MVSVTLAVPQELKIEMDKHPELNWSEIARQAIWEKLVVLKRMDMLLSSSALTKEDALQFGRKVSKTLAKRYRRMV